MEKSDILKLISSSPSPITKREIARALGLKGGNFRVALKQILKQLESDGVISKNGGAYTVPDGLPGVTVVEVTEISIDGDVIAKPVEWNSELQGAPPRVEIMPDKKGHPSVKAGDRALVRLKRVDPQNYEAFILKKMDAPENRVMGELRIHKSGLALLMPADKKAKYEFEIPTGNLNGARDGDLVVGEIVPARGSMRKKARIVEVIGRRDDPKAISLISLHEKGLNEKFPERVIEETKDMKVPPINGREDLRKIPLVTIDGADARDFDDAVFAEKTEDGFHIIVAIADVSYYVRSYSPLDKEAQRRGNSTYFPDRVVPMLPEALSNDLCSLRPREDRACLAVHMHIDENGKLLRHKFVRGLMRSEARLIYEDVQAAYDNQKHDLIQIINSLYDAFRILDKARAKRGALELDLPERKIVIDAKGNMVGVKKRERLDAHRMIEEFMILANVAAATALEARQAACVYRVHERPSLMKLDSVREFIQGFGFTLPKGQAVDQREINLILKKAKEMPYSHLISEMMLRSQSQAVYSPRNLGHFGLALQRYAHFTSPIRRYADLLVHRSLIRAYGLGEGGLDDGEEARLEEICEHISQTERTSMEAERSAIDRFTASYLSEQIGAQFKGRISGVTRFGLFVTLDESGADGIVPMRSLPDDFYIHDEQAHALVGRSSRRIFQLGANVTVALREADGLSGSTVLELLNAEMGATIPGMAPKISMSSQGDRGRGRRDRDFRDGGGGGHKRRGKKGKRTMPKHKRREKHGKK